MDRYGNNFAFADDDVIERATVVLDPPTVSNLIAMEVSGGGRGGGEGGREEGREEGRRGGK